jgi:hypothetical protein
VGPRTGLSAVEERKISSHVENGTPAAQLIARKVYLIIILNLMARILHFLDISYEVLTTLLFRSWAYTLILSSLKMVTIQLC